MKFSIVCCATQEASACHTREYIDRKNNNAIFAYMQLLAASTKLDNFCCGDALHRQYPTFLNCARYKLSKIGLFSWFFLLVFSLLFVKLCGNGFYDCLEVWYTERWYKGTSWYQVWLEYSKHLQNYLQLFTKNNTNMLSLPQGKLHMARSWKLVQR